MCGFCNMCVCVYGFCNVWVFWLYVYLYLLCFCIVSSMFIYSFYVFVQFCKLCIFIDMFVYSYCYVYSVLYILFSPCQMAFFGYRH